MDMGNNKPAPSSIIIDNIIQKFGNFTALDSVSLEIEQGEIFGLLGPNGAGKTTLLNILCGLSWPAGGNVTIFGMKFEEHHNDIRKLLGYVPQETALYEHLTAEENLLFHARFYGVPPAQRKIRVQNALELAQLESRRKSRVKEFSGGMKRRLAIVRSLIHEPRILMLDEPSLGVDVQSRVEIWEKIKEMRRDKTIIVTTNYMEEADYLCDRVAILDHGRLIALGSPDELKKALLGEIIELTLKEAHKGYLDNLAQIYRDITDNFTVKELHEKGAGWSRISLRVPDASSRVTEVLEITKSQNIEISEVNVRAPSLNDVFIELTGKKLRE